MSRPSTQSLRIVVTGLIAQHPSLAGMTWHYLQYLAGLKQLGHDVWYFEDSGEWPYTLDGGTTGQDWVARDGAANIEHLDRVMTRFGLGDRWAYRLATSSEWFGLAPITRREVMQSADLLLNVSGSLERPEEYAATIRAAYIDSDPVFTQIKFALADIHAGFRDRVDAHHVHFTFGERLKGRAPETGHVWHPTRQPILLSEWTCEYAHRNVYTTVMAWTSYPPVEYCGQLYAQKDVEFGRFLDLPSHLASARLEVAMNGTHHRNWENAARACTATAVAGGNGTVGLLASSGWQVVEPADVCGSLDTYRSYVQTSKGEWSVAKNGYVMGQVGWFSERSACYLAAGRPVIVQDTGFGEVLPTGLGIVPFSTPTEAAIALRTVEANYSKHSQAARDIAEAYFDSSSVLNRLLESAFA